MSQRLSALDAAFLNAETACTPMHIGGVLIFRAKPEAPNRPGLNALFDTVQDRLALIPRCRQVLVPVPFGLGLPVWADADRFDIRRHLRRIRLRPPGTREQLLEMVARLHSRHLDRSKPLWEMYLIDGMTEDQVAVYAKLHHAMADGISAVELGLVLLDLDPAGEMAPEVPDDVEPQPIPTSLELLAAGPRQAAEQAATLFRRAVDPLPWPIGTREARALNGGPLRRMVPNRSDAREIAGSAWRGTAAGLGAALSLRELSSALRPAPAGPFNRRVGPRRRLEVVQLPLNGAKAIKNGLGGTVNDVVLALVAESIHLYLNQRHGETHADLRYRVMVPMSVRSENEKMNLEQRLKQQLHVSNKVIGTFVDLPVGPMAPARRLWLIQQLMGKAKTGQAEAAGRVLDLASMSPAAVQRATIRAGLAGQRVVNLVVSNVPGIQMPVYSGGSRLLEVYPTLPLTPNTAVIVCVLSYDNSLHFGIVGDPDAVPDIEYLANGLRRAYHTLRQAAGGRTKTRAGRRQTEPAASKELVPV